MNKIHRINARKVVLSYFYLRFIGDDILANMEVFLNIKDDKKEEWQIEFLNKLWKTLTKEEIELIKDVYNRYLLERWIGVEFDIKDIKIYTDETFKEDVFYIVNNFFKKEKKVGIDIDYVLKVWEKFSEFKQVVEEKVNSLAKSFEFSEMDYIDRAIFLLGYIEYNIIQTPRQVILNEMIELAKRYWDEWSYKLINWIWHYLLLNK